MGKFDKRMDRHNVKNRKDAKVKKDDEKNIEFTQRFENKLITPDMAREMLSHNYEGNRNRRDSYVSQLADVIRRGGYISQNGQTIVFGIDDGILYDGQHRLAAIVESNTSLVFGIAYIKDGKEAYKTIDNGTRRQAADFLNVPSKNHCAAVGKFMACVEWGAQPLLSCLQGKWTAKTVADRGIVVTYVEQNAEKVVDAVRRGMVMKNAIAASTASVFAKFILLVKYCGMDENLNEFIGEFSKTASLNQTVTALKMTIIKSVNDKNKKTDERWMLGTLLDGYTHFCEMDGSTMFNKQTVRLMQYQKYIDATRGYKAKSGD